MSRILNDLLAKLPNLEKGILSVKDAETFLKTIGESGNLKTEVHSALSPKNSIAATIMSTDHVCRHITLSVNDEKLVISLIKLEELSKTSLPRVDWGSVEREVGIDSILTEGMSMMSIADKLGIENAREFVGSTSFNTRVNDLGRTRRLKAA